MKNETSAVLEGLDIAISGAEYALQRPGQTPETMQELKEEISSLMLQRRLADTGGCRNRRNNKSRKNKWN